MRDQVLSTSGVPIARAFLARIVLVDSAVIRDRSTGCISGALDDKSAKMRCWRQDNFARQWNRRSSRRSGDRKARSRLIEKVAHLYNAIVTYFFFSFSWQLLDISRLRRSDGERARSHDAVSAHRVMRNRFRLGTCLTCTDLISHRARIGKSNGNF